MIEHVNKTEIGHPTSKLMKNEVDREMRRRNIQ